MPIGVVHRRLWRMFRTIENVLFWWWKNTRIRKFRLAYEKPKNMNENKFSVIECWSWEGWQSKRATHPALVERIRSPALSETCCFQSVIWEIDTTHWRHEPIVARALVVAVSRLKFFFFLIFFVTEQCIAALSKCTRSTGTKKAARTVATKRVFRLQAQTGCGFSALKPSELFDPRRP